MGGKSGISIPKIKIKPKVGAQLQKLAKDQLGKVTANPAQMFTKGPESIAQLGQQAAGLGQQAANQLLGQAPKPDFKALVGQLNNVGNMDNLKKLAGDRGLMEMGTVKQTPPATPATPASPATPPAASAPAAPANAAPAPTPAPAPAAAPAAPQPRQVDYQSRAGVQRPTTISPAQNFQNAQNQMYQKPAPAPTAPAPVQAAPSGSPAPTQANQQTEEEKKKLAGQV